MNVIDDVYYNDVVTSDLIKSLIEIYPLRELLEIGIMD